MLLPIKPICERKDVRRDGTSLVNIQYCYSSQHLANLNTGIAIPPDFWIKKNQQIAPNLPPNYGNATRLNEAITRLFRMAEDIITFATKSKLDNVLAFVKKTFHPDFDVRSLLNEENANKLIESFPLDIRANPNIFDQIDSYIESKKKKVSGAHNNPLDLSDGKLLTRRQFILSLDLVIKRLFEYGFYIAALSQHILCQAHKNYLFQNLSHPGHELHEQRPE